MHFKIALLVFKAVVQLLYVGVVSSSNVSSMLCRYLQSLLRFRFHVRIGIIFNTATNYWRASQTYIDQMRHNNENEWMKWNAPWKKDAEKRHKFFFKKDVWKKDGEKDEKHMWWKDAHCTALFHMVPFGSLSVFLSGFVAWFFLFSLQCKFIQTY